MVAELGSLRQIGDGDQCHDADDCDGNDGVDGRGRSRHHCRDRDRATFQSVTANRFPLPNHRYRSDSLSPLGPTESFAT